MDESVLSLVLFSGTDDKLKAAAVLTAGAAALGRPVHLFLQYWALDAFRADRIEADHGLAPEAGAGGQGQGRRAAGRRPGQLGRDPAPGQGPRRGRHPGLLAVDGPAPARGVGPRSARRRRRGRDRLLPRRRRRPDRLHLVTRHPHPRRNLPWPASPSQPRSTPATSPARCRSSRPRRQIKTIASGELVEVLATDPGSVKDFAAWSRSTGNALVEQTQDGNVYRFVIRRA